MESQLILGCVVTGRQVDSSVYNVHNVLCLLAYGVVTVPLLSSIKNVDIEKAVHQSKVFFDKT